VHTALAGEPGAALDRLNEIRHEIQSAVDQLRELHSGLLSQPGMQLAQLIDRALDLVPDLVQPVDQLRELHSGLLSLYLGYREIKAYPEMVELFEAMP